jgi:hypothetical protein
MSPCKQQQRNVGPKSSTGFVQFTRAEAVLFSALPSLLEYVPANPERLVEALQRLPPSLVNSKMDSSAPRRGVFLRLLVKLLVLSDIEMKMIKAGAYGFLRVPRGHSFVLSQVPDAIPS